MQPTNNQQTPSVAETNVAEQPKPMQTMSVAVPEDNAMALRGGGTPLS